MADCERHIQSACALAERLRAEVEKKAPSMTVIDTLSRDLHKETLELKYFEFCVERRKTVVEALRETS